MIGTIVNTFAIIVGVVVGTLLHRGVKEKYSGCFITDWDWPAS